MGSDTLTVLISSIGGLFSVFFALLVILFNRLEKIDDKLLAILVSHEDKIDNNGKRSDVLDRALSHVADQKFSSRSIVKDGRDEPSFERFKAALAKTLGHH